jgi:hypothetical protein
MRKGKRAKITLAKSKEHVGLCVYAFTAMLKRHGYLERNVMSVEKFKEHIKPYDAATSELEELEEKVDGGTLDTELSRLKNELEVTDWVMNKLTPYSKELVWGVRKNSNEGDYFED